MRVGSQPTVLPLNYSHHIIKELFFVQISRVELKGPLRTTALQAALAPYETIRAFVACIGFEPMITVGKTIVLTARPTGLVIHVVQFI